jgi:hypothetical protein
VQAGVEHAQGHHNVLSYHLHLDLGCVLG